MILVPPNPAEATWIIRTRANLSLLHKKCPNISQGNQCCPLEMDTYFCLSAMTLKRLTRHLSMKPKGRERCLHHALKVPGQLNSRSKTILNNLLHAAEATNYRFWTRCRRWFRSMKLVIYLLHVSLLLRAGLRGLTQKMLPEKRWSTCTASWARKK